MVSRICPAGSTRDPGGDPGVVVGAVQPAAVDDRAECGRIGLVDRLKDLEVGLDDVGGWRQEVRDKVHARRDPRMDRTVDLDPLDKAVRDRERTCEDSKIPGTGQSLEDRPGLRGVRTRRPSAESGPSDGGFRAAEALHAKPEHTGAGSPSAKKQRHLFVLHFCAARHVRKSVDTAVRNGAALPLPEAHTHSRSILARPGIRRTHQKRQPTLVWQPARTPSRQRWRTPPAHR
jgi:hypothetical protein